MGTRGFIAYKYKGYYVIIYNHWDSYPTYLGKRLVASIPQSEDEFQRWLAVHRKDCDGRSDRTTSPPANDIFIEWTYTFDLDNLNFIVDSRAAFDLRAIAKSSDSWIQFIWEDARGNRCLRLNTPPELVGKFPPRQGFFLGKEPVPPTDISITKSVISRSTWSQPLSQHHCRLMLILANAVIGENYSGLSTLHKHAPGKQLFRFALSFLESIIPNNQALLTTVDDIPLLKIKISMHTDCGPWFWYRRCLVLLAEGLDDEARFDIYVRAVVARVKAKNLASCTTLLWSVRHVAVVIMESDGSVSHSAAIPLLAAYGSDEESFTSALCLLWYYLPEPRRRIVDESKLKGSGLLDNSDSSDFGILPTELVLKIMEFTDELEYPKYQFLSYGFFDLFWSHARVGPYTLIPDLAPIEGVSFMFNAREDGGRSLVLVVSFNWGVGSNPIWGGDGHPVEARSISFGFDTHKPDDPAFLTIYLQHLYTSGSDDSVSGENYLSRVRDNFGSHTRALRCQVLV